MDKARNRGCASETLETEQVHCLLCGSSESEFLYALEDYYTGQPGRFALVKCLQCGGEYLNPRPTIGAMSAFYPTTYEPHATPSTHLSWLPRWLVQYGLWKRCRPLLMWRSPGKILDVGCGTGHFLAAMQKYGTWEVVGIDLNPEAVAFARSVLKIEAYTGRIEDIGLPPHIFDAVTMWDTLEHLRDPRSALLGVWRVLKPDGRLLLRVPSLDSLDACLFGRYWAGLDAPRHLVVFSQKTLKRLLEETGFMVERLWCLSGGQASFILSLRLRFGRCDQAGWLRSVLLKIATHPLVLILSMPYFFIMDRLLLGPEITVLAKKQAR